MAAPLLALSGGCNGADSSRILGSWVLDSVAVDGVFRELEAALASDNGRDVVAWFDFGANSEFFGEGPSNDVAGRYHLDLGLLAVEDEVGSGTFCASSSLPDEAFMDIDLFDALLGTPTVHFSSDIRMQWQTDRITLTFRRAP